MLPVGREQDEEPLVTQVLNARRPRLLSSRPRELGDGQAIAFDDATVDVPRVLPLANRPRHVEEITVSQVGRRELLDEAFEGGRLASVFKVAAHRPFTSKQCRMNLASRYAGTLDQTERRRVSASLQERDWEEICFRHKSLEKPGEMTCGVSSSTSRSGGGIVGFGHVFVAKARIKAATFLLEVAQCIAVASLPSLNVVLNLKTQLGRCVPIQPSCEDSRSGNPRMTAFTAGPRTATQGDSFSSPRSRDDA